MNKDDYYQVLGVPKNASEDDIKKAYRKLAKIHHPDKNGGTDSEEFKIIGNAYQTLIDADKRRQYDMFGPDDDGMRQQQQHHNMGGIFDMFGAAVHQQQAKQKVVHVKFPLSIFINSGNVDVAYTRQVKCETCDGTGSKTKQCTTCKKCNGQKIIYTPIQLGPMTLQQPCTCPKCNGRGEMISNENKCTDCNGIGSIPKDEKCVVYISSGLPSKFPEMPKYVEVKDKGDYMRDTKSYNSLVVIVDIDESKLSETKILLPNGDILINMDIPLANALCGFTSFLITLPSGETVTLKSTIVLNPSKPFVIENEGLFYEGDRHRRGNVIITWKIVYPDTLDATTMNALKKYLKPENEEILISAPRSISVTK